MCRYFVLVCVVGMGGCVSVQAPPAVTTAPSPQQTAQATPEQMQAWEDTLPGRAPNKCVRLVRQLEGQSLTDALAGFEGGYVKGDCLALQPTGITPTDIPYGGLYVGIGGTFDTGIPQDQWEMGENWPGHCIMYLSDSPLVPVELMP